ncbi:MAG TPA: endonuclease/exonuclease/phosphatase family protein [Gemmatimonadales bacterium]|nr:endonuclease/exonuclease/phosphatase family protein [Gemmatimonadales bacterium]
MQKTTLLALALLFTACTDQAPTAPTVDAARGTDLGSLNADLPGITVLTWNVYAGAEVERVLQAQTPDQAVAIATDEWANVQATNFPARAGRIARNIAAARADVVALEEVALYRTTDRPFDELATHVAYDYLELVIDSLRARKLEYTAAAVDRTTDIQVPVITGFDAFGAPVLGGVRYTDGDAVLVRRGIHYSDARSGIYEATLPVTVGGTSAVVSQGWSSVDVEPYRVVVTHLAGQEVQDIQLAQARELLALLNDGRHRPTLLMGDFNSDAYGADPTRVTPTYQMVLAAGFTDTWTAVHRHAPGLTCCEQPDLLNALPTFDQRIDFIFARNNTHTDAPVRSLVVGDSQADRVLGLWPSDHAGVVATFGTEQGVLSSPHGTVGRGGPSAALSLNF